MAKRNRGVFPSRQELEDAIIEALTLLGGQAGVPEINAKVIEILALPKEIVELEDESGVGTKLNYRLRWCRTNLKEAKKIVNVRKGFWELNKD